MNEFSNTPIELNDLPVLGDEAFTPVAPNYLRMSLTVMGVFAGVVFGCGLAVTAVVQENKWVPLLATGVVLLLFAASAIARIVEVRHIAYQVREHDLSYRRGVFIKTVSTVPFVRVQHARVRSGPVERRFGLATLDVNSAGPDLHVSGLTSADAERLKALVVERAGDLEEEL